MSDVEVLTCLNSIYVRTSSLQEEAKEMNSSSSSSCRNTTTGESHLTGGLLKVTRLTLAYLLYIHHLDLSTPFLSIHLLLL